MKIVLVFILTFTLSGPVLAASLAAAMPTTEAACKDAGMKWKERAGKCKPKNTGRPLSPTKKIVGLIGLGCGLIALYVLWSPNSLTNGRG